MFSVEERLELGFPLGRQVLFRNALHRALEAGVDIVSTTLAGYVPGGRAKTDGPDLEFLREAVAVAGDTPVFCEGRIHTTADARAAIDAGAFAIVVGTAITHPQSITGWFAEAIG